MRKFLASLLAASLVASMGVAAFADGDVSGGTPPAAESTANVDTVTEEKTEETTEKTEETTEKTEETTEKTEETTEKTEETTEKTEETTEKTEAITTEKPQAEETVSEDYGIMPLALNPDELTAKLTVRPDGANTGYSGDSYGSADSFKYSAAYGAAGASFNANTGTITVNTTTLATAEGQKAAGASAGGSKKSYAFFGIKIEAKDVPSAAKYFKLTHSSGETYNENQKGTLSAGSDGKGTLITYVPFAQKGEGEGAKWEEKTGSYTIRVEWYPEKASDDSTVIDETNLLATTEFTLKVVTTSETKFDTTPVLVQSLSPSTLSMDGTALSGNVKAGLDEAHADVKKWFVGAKTTGLTYATVHIPVPAGADVSSSVKIVQNNAALNIAYPDSKQFPDNVKAKTYSGDDLTSLVKEGKLEYNFLIKPGEPVGVTVTWNKTAGEGESAGTAISQFTFDTSGIKLSVPTENYTAGTVKFISSNPGGASLGTLTADETTPTKYTVTGENAKIAYSPADAAKGTPAGWRVGLEVDPPTFKERTAVKVAVDQDKTTYTINGDDPKTNVKPEFTEGGSALVYPTTTSGTNGKSFTLTVNWVEAKTGTAYPVTYTIDLSNAALAEKEQWTLTYKAVLVKGGVNGANKVEDLAGYGVPKIDKGATLNTLKLSDPTYSGYVFSGWYANNNNGLGSALNFSSEVSSDTILLAKFVKEAGTAVNSVVNNDNVKAVIEAVRNDQTPNSTEAAAAKTAIADLVKDSTPQALAKAVDKTTLTNLDEVYKKIAYVNVAKTNNNTSNGPATDCDEPIKEVEIVTGAALSVEAGTASSPKTVKLAVKNPTEIIPVPQIESQLSTNMKVNKMAQVDIVLKVGDTDPELKAPLYCSLLLPRRFDKDKVKIFKEHKGQLKELNVTFRQDGFDTYGDVMVTELSTFAIVEVDQSGSSGGTQNPGGGSTNTPSYSHGGSGGGGGGGSSSSNKNASIFTKMTNTINSILKMRLTGGKGVANNAAAIPAAPLTASAGKTAMNTAISKAVDGKATAALRSVTTIAPEILSSMASQAAKAGVTATIAADTMDGAAVGVRVYVDAAAAAKLGRAIDVSAVAGNAAAEKALAASYKNKFVLLDMGQDGPFGMNVNIAARLNFAGMDKTKLAFYSYNEKTKQLIPIEAPAFWFDANGYIHFSTTMGNCIVISDGPLVQK